MKTEIEVDNENGIRMESELIKENQTSDDGWTHNVWRMTLFYQNRTFSATCQTGKGLKKLSLKEYLDSAFSDANVEEYTSFQSWSNEHSDEFLSFQESLKNEVIFNRCLNLAQDLRTMFGADYDDIKNQYLG